MWPSVEPDVITYNAKQSGNAMKLRKVMQQKCLEHYVISHSTAISGCENAKRSGKALKLLEVMQPSYLAMCS